MKTDKIGITFDNGHDIPWHMIETKEELTGQIIFLEEKNWFTNSTRFDFIGAVCRRMKWDILEFV